MRPPPMQSEPKEPLQTIHCSISESLTPDPVYSDYPMNYGPSQRRYQTLSGREYSAAMSLPRSFGIHEDTTPLVEEGTPFRSYDNSSLFTNRNAYHHDMIEQWKTPDHSAKPNLGGNLHAGSNTIGLRRSRRLQNAQKASKEATS